MTEDKKQGSLNVVDLSIATSSFFDLDNTTSWVCVYLNSVEEHYFHALRHNILHELLCYLKVLLPCSMMLSLTGPIDKPAMDINIVVDPVSLTISPAIVRLIIHAAKTLTPEKVVLTLTTCHTLENSY